MSKFLDASDLYGSYKHVQELGHTMERMAPKLFDSWLYGSYDKQKYDLFTALYAVPYLHDYMDWRLDVRAAEEYMYRYGMDYSDIHDPRKLQSTGSQSRVIGHAYNFVSKNVSRLYR